MSTLHTARLLTSLQSVLIHSGTGGLGIAAIQVARMIGADVYVTAGTHEKRQYLVDALEIPSEHVFDSRNSSFLPALLRITDGHGVDVVLNSLTGDLMQNSLEACAPFGRFIEVGKKDILENTSLPMGGFERCLSFISFDLTEIYRSGRSQHRDLWKA